ncbi:hypothetical protein Tco_0065961 [Tanacetum coccineum]
MIFSPFTPFLLNIVLFFPKSNHTVFDAPPGFIYRGSTLLVMPNSPLLLSCAKLMVVRPLSTSSEGSSICVELCLGRYPTSVRVFPDLILFLAGPKPSCEYGQQRPANMAGDTEMAFRNFIYTEDDEELSFLPKEPSSGFDTDSRESPKPELFVVHPGSVAARIKDKKCKTKGGSSRHLVKRKISHGSSTSCATHAKTSSSKDDAPFLTVSDDDEGLLDVLDLKDATACHLKISAITPLA